MPALHPDLTALLAQARRACADAARGRAPSAPGPAELGCGEEGHRMDGRWGASVPSRLALTRVGWRREKGNRVRYPPTPPPPTIL